MAISGAIFILFLSGLKRFLDRLVIELFSQYFNQYSITIYGLNSSSCFLFLINRLSGWRGSWSSGHDHYPYASFTDFTCAKNIDPTWRTHKRKHRLFDRGWFNDDYNFPCSYITTILMAKARRLSLLRFVCIAFGARPRARGSSTAGGRCHRLSAKKSAEAFNGRVISGYT